MINFEDIAASASYLDTCTSAPKVDSSTNTISAQSNNILDKYKLSGEFIQDEKYGFVYPIENYILNITITNTVTGEVVTNSDTLYIGKRGSIHTVVESENLQQEVRTHWGNLIDYPVERSKCKYYTPDGNIIKFIIIEE